VCVGGDVRRGMAQRALRVVGLCLADVVRPRDPVDAVVAGAAGLAGRRRLPRIGLRALVAVHAVALVCRILDFVHRDAHRVLVFESSSPMWIAWMKGVKSPSPFDALAAESYSFCGVWHTTQVLVSVREPK